MYVFISPHFDDAIGSAGGVINRLVESGEECCIMTIMTAIPWYHPKYAYYVLHRHSENKSSQGVKMQCEECPVSGCCIQKGDEKTDEAGEEKVVHSRSYRV